MTPEEIAALVKSTAEETAASITAAMKTAPVVEPVAPVAPVVEPVVVKDGAPPTAREIAQEMKGLMDEDKTSQANQVYDTMWKENYAATVAKVQGLDEFIKDKDDYGHVRLEQLNKIESYNDRVAALGTLAVSFQEASVGSTNRRPVVNKKVEAHKKESQDEYQKMIDKQNNNEYTSKAQMNADFFASFEKESRPLITS